MKDIFPLTLRFALHQGEKKKKKSLLYLILSKSHSRVQRIYKIMYFLTVVLENIEKKGNVN